MPDRKELLKTWLDQLGYQNYEFIKASEDASFRRYFRLRCDGLSWIVMDAPPAKESCEAFVSIARQLRACRLSAPEIIQADMALGFLLMTDFGDTQYLDVLTSETYTSLYDDAMSAILQMQLKLDAGNLPDYDAALLLAEMDLFRDWFVEKLLGITLTEQQQTDWVQIKNMLVQNSLEQPQVFVHRDFHSRNLMKLDDKNPAILDFQDAVKGPITYDLVSLLRDCYIDWPPSTVEQLVKDYYERVKHNKLTDVSVSQFLRWFNLTGVQRHLKAIGIFARLNIRDGKKQFLKDIPRTLEYIRQVSLSDVNMVGLGALIKELDLNHRMTPLL